MKKSEAARYARWSAAVALVFAGLTVAVYLKRGWTRHVEREHAPPAAPQDVERQSSHLTFSKGEGTRKIFTVEASKSIDFKGLNSSDLEGVKITIFGKEGARHDTMETHACRYTKDSGDISCAGDVEIILMSADQWNAAGGKPGAPGTMKIETRGVSFNRASGEAITKDEVRFMFANGNGQATGAEYNSEKGTLRLQKDVRLQLDQPVAANAKSAISTKRMPVQIVGSRMDFSRDAGTMYLLGPAEAKTQTDRLTAAAFLLELDGDFHAKRLTAKSNGKKDLPEFSAAKGAGKQRLSAEEITATFAPEGWVRHAEAKGQVSGESVQDEARQTMKAQNASMEMAPGGNALKLLVMKGGVDAKTSTRANGKGEDSAPNAEDTRELTTEELRLKFAENSGQRGTRKIGAKGVKLVSADTPGAGRIEWRQAENANATASQTVLQANQLAMQFDGNGKPSRLDGQGDVRTERAVNGAETETATAKKGFVELQEQGGWSRMELSDDVKLNAGTRTAQADRAVFERAAQTATLTGHVVAKDATSLTSARKLTFWQATGDVRGEGAVRSSDLSAHGGPFHLAPVAANVSADQLSANSKSGRALYTGHARLWQGDSVLEADSIELLKNERRMNAAGKVRAIFPQAPGNAPGDSAATVAAKATKNSSGAKIRQPVLWHAQSEKLTYWDRENRARLDQQVVVQSPEEKITSAALDLYFAKANSAATQTVSAKEAVGIAGSQQISRAVATGGVVVQQGERRAAAERGEYTAAEGKFVMTGGAPTLFDALEGTTTGRQLTFFLADATIIVDSENGSRTLTKHRVEK
ncbi:MAG TPA: LptA/OstA family protein [Candidatus Acidoferrum sp.]|jgi:lipopolysaccharide export system protein LptA